MSLARWVLLAVALTAAPRAADACVLEGVTPIVFGDYDVFANSDREVLGGVRYYCLVGLSISITLSTGSSGTYAQRKLQRVGGGDTMNYQLYVDAAKTQIWGNGTGSSKYGPFIGLLVSTTVPIYAVLPKKQNVRTGQYTDTIVVTFNY